MKIIKGENTVYEKLLELGISLRLIEPQNFPSKEISVLARSLGIIKSNGAKIQSFWKFNEIEINEFINGKKTIIFSLFPANSTDIQQIADMLFSILGTDSSQRKLFLPYEALIFEKESYSINPTRQWLEFKDYDVDLKGYLESEIITLTLIEKIKGYKKQ